MSATTCAQEAATHSVHEVPWGTPRVVGSGTETTALLRPEEEVELGQWIEAGLYAEYLLRTGEWAVNATAEALAAVADEGRKAFHRFVTANVRLAAWTARRRVAAGAAGGMDTEDLTAEGVLGVIRAVQKWDYTRGLKFSTYATHWARQFQQRAVARSGALSCSAIGAERCHQVLDAQYRLARKLDRTPTADELAEDLGIPVRAVLDALTVAKPALSLDAPVSHDSRSATLADLVPAAVADVGDEPPWAGVDVAGLLRCLTSREREVVVEVFGLGDGTARTVAEIAEQWRVRPELVSRTANSALEKMRAAVQERPEAA